MSWQCCSEVSKFILDEFPMRTSPAIDNLSTGSMKSLGIFIAIPAATSLGSVEDIYFVELAVADATTLSTADTYEKPFNIYCIQEPKKS